MKTERVFLMELVLTINLCFLVLSCCPEKTCLETKIVKGTAPAVPINKFMFFFGPRKEVETEECVRWSE